MNLNIDYPLISAATRGDMDAVKCFIKIVTNINATDQVK